MTRGLSDQVVSSTGYQIGQPTVPSYSVNLRQARALSSAEILRWFCNGQVYQIEDKKRGRAVLGCFLVFCRNNPLMRTKQMEMIVDFRRTREHVIFISIVGNDVEMVGLWWLKTKDWPGDTVVDLYLDLLIYIRPIWVGGFALGTFVDPLQLICVKIKRL